MNAGTPTSFAPGVSVFGMIRSAIAATVSNCFALRYRGWPVAFALAAPPGALCARITPARIDGDSAAPNTSTARLMASRRLTSSALVDADSAPDSIEEFIVRRSFAVSGLRGLQVLFLEL